jgi:DNA adenine methylase
MFFRREGNKTKYSADIIRLFPPHKMYIEPFVGTGGIFFNKPLAKFNILNDNSKFIYDLFVILKDREKLENMIKEIEFTPQYLDYIKDHVDEPLKSILIFNYGFFGQENCQQLGATNYKAHTLKEIDRLKDILLQKLQNTNIVNMGYDAFLNSISNDKLANPKSETFIYCDPPYSISKGALKDNKGWDGLNDLEKLINACVEFGCNFAISEYNDEPVVNLFKKYNLNIHTVSKSKVSNKKKVKYEILATNYEPYYTNGFFNMMGDDGEKS